MSSSLSKRRLSARLWEAGLDDRIAAREEAERIASADRRQAAHQEELEEIQEYAQRNWIVIPRAGMAEVRQLALTYREKVGCSFHDAREWAELAIFNAGLSDTRKELGKL